MDFRRFAFSNPNFFVLEIENEKSFHLFRISIGGELLYGAWSTIHFEICEKTRPVSSEQKVHSSLAPTTLAVKISTGNDPRNISRVVPGQTHFTRFFPSHRASTLATQVGIANESFSTTLSNDFSSGVRTGSFFFSGTGDDFANIRPKFGTKVGTRGWGEKFEGGIRQNRIILLTIFMVSTFSHVTRRANEQNGIMKNLLSSAPSQYFSELLTTETWKRKKIEDCLVRLPLSVSKENSGADASTSLVLAIDAHLPGFFHCRRVFLEEGKIEVPFADGSLRRLDSDEKFILVETGSTPTSDRASDRAFVEEMVSRLLVSVTGARVGESIWGSHPTISGGATMKVVVGTIPASKTDLDLIRSFPGIWRTFLKKLEVVEFFSGLSELERAVWLFENQKSGEFDFGDVGSDPAKNPDESEVFLKVEDVGKGKFLSVDPENLAQILEGPEDAEGEGDSPPALCVAWSATQIRNFFPRKPGSKARHNTLAFWPRFWRLAAAFEKVGCFSAGPVYLFPSEAEKSGFVNGKKLGTVEGGIVLFSGLAATSEKKANGRPGYEVTEKMTIGIALPLSSPTPKTLVFEKLAERYEVEVSEIEKVARAYRNFTPGAHKSLIQKLIRYSAVRAEWGDDGETESTTVEIASAVSFIELLYSPGSFVPDIQRFVGGQESAFKRLMVSVLEDSYFPDASRMEMLAVLALVSQRLTSWRPSLEIIEMCLDVSDFSVSSNLWWNYRTDGKIVSAPPVSVSHRNTPLQNVSALLDELRSFESDLFMTRAIASRDEVVKGLRDRPDVMHISRAYDHHFATECVHLLPYDVVDSLRVKGTKPFDGVFGKLWDLSSSTNPRKEKWDAPLKKKSDRRLKKLVAEAQRLILKVKQTPYGISVGGLGEDLGSYRLRSTIDISWLAGMVGPMNGGDRPSAMATLKPDDPYAMVAVKKPSRGMKDGTLTDEQSEAAIAKAKKILEAGVVLGRNGSTPPIEKMRDVTVRSINGEFSFSRVGESKKEKPVGWESLAKVREEIPFVESNAVAETFFVEFVRGDGMSPDAFGILDERLREYPVAAIRRLLTYLGVNKPVIELNRISKDGGGTAEAVMIEDVGVCQLLLFISAIFPAALSRCEFFVSKFRVELAPLLWKIRDAVRETLAEISKSESTSARCEWKKLKDRSGREPRAYQTDCLQEMVARTESGKKGNFLWLVVGLGKTLIVMMYCAHLICSGLAPTYIIYALPKSALESIITEIEFFGGRINLLNPTGTWKKHPKADYSKSNRVPLAGHFNLIEHDHLRLLETELIEVIGDSLLIVDEVHKTLNTSKRTGVALELSRLSRDFVVLTGTPVIDSNTFKLIQWLEQIVEFEVNDKNFWVGAMGMVSRGCNTGVEVRREEIEVVMSEKDERRYRKLVPAGMGGKNANPTAKDIIEAFEVCYEACDSVMVETIVKNLKHGVFVVAKNSKHQTLLRDALVATGKVKSKSIFVMTGKESLFLTDETVASGKTPDYSVVITTLGLSAGYTLTRLKKMVTSVYPTNLATITQLEGRINRVSQTSPFIEIITVHTGILTYTLQKHKTAASISAVLSAMAKEVGVDASRVDV